MSEPYYPQTIDDLIAVKDAAKISGLELFQAMIRGEMPSAPIGETMNFRPVAATSGSVTFQGAPGFEACNPLGTVHGGWYGTILDSSMACAVMTMLKPGQGSTTLEYKVNITRALKIGTEVECTGVVLHMGRTTGVATGTIVGVEDGKTYATGSTTCLVLT